MWADLVRRVRACPRADRTCPSAVRTLGSDTRTPRLGRPLPLDLAALVSLGLLEEVQPGLFRRPRLPSRAEVHGAHPTHDHETEETDTQ